MIETERGAAAELPLPSFNRIRKPAGEMAVHVARCTPGDAHAHALTMTCVCAHVRARVRGCIRARAFKREDIKHLYFSDGRQTSGKIRSRVE